jgi:two-component system response regulator ResD
MSKPPKKVLLVDDEDMVRRALRRFLTKEKYEVYEANSATQALSVFHEHRPFDMLLCDVCLGKDDGWETAAKIYISQPSLVVMMISGYLVHERIPRALHHYRMLYKPFTPTELRRELVELWEAESSI